MRWNLFTWLLLLVYLVLPPYICVGEYNHVEVEAGVFHYDNNAHDDGLAEFSTPQEHHHHQTCVDLPLPAESGVKTFLPNASAILADTVDDSSNGKEIILAHTDASFLTTALLSALRSTVLIV